MSERSWGKGHVVGSDQFFTGRSTSSDSSEALRKAAERSVQQSKEESMTTENSPEAVAAYPSIMGEEEITKAERIAFDRGMAEMRALLSASLPSEAGQYFDRAGDEWTLDAEGQWTDKNGSTRLQSDNWMIAVAAAPMLPVAERRVVKREALVWQVRAAIEPFLETFVYLDLNIQADNEQMDAFATAIVDAILAVPYTSLTGAREAVAGAIHDDLAARGISLMPERDALHESKGDQCWAIADALFASGTISERREAEAGDEAWVIEVDWAEDEARNTLPALIGPFPSRKAAQDCGEDIIFNGDWGVAQVSDAAQLRNGEGDRG